MAQAPRAHHIWRRAKWDCNSISLRVCGPGFPMYSARGQHLLDLGQSLLQLADLLLLLLDLVLLVAKEIAFRLRAVILLLDFIEQHAGEKLVANRIRRTVDVVRNQFREDLGHFLGDQTVLQRARASIVL